MANPKTPIWVGLFLGSTLGGWLGAAISHNNWFGWQSILLGALGAFAGIYAGYKLSQICKLSQDRLA